MHTIEIPKEKRKYIGDLHFEHQLWSNQLRFFQDELRVFEDRLAEVIERNSATEIRAEGEHFQNQFIREKEVIDELLHDMKIQEQELANYAKDHPVAIDHKYFEDHFNLEDRMAMFNKIYSELKQEFMRYLSKWM